MNEIFGYMDRHFDRFVEESTDLVRIPGINTPRRVGWRLAPVIWSGP